MTEINPTGKYSDHFKHLYDTYYNVPQSLLISMFPFQNKCTSQSETVSENYSGRKIKYSKCISTDHYIWENS